MKETETELKPKYWYVTKTTVCVLCGKEKKIGGGYMKNQALKIKMFGQIMPAINTLCKY